MLDPAVDSLWDQRAGQRERDRQAADDRRHHRQRKDSAPVKRPDVQPNSGNQQREHVDGVEDHVLRDHPCSNRTTGHS